MSHILMVPIQLNALHLVKSRKVVEAMADFSRLPYFDGKGDKNTETAYISEDLVSQPFNENLTLSPGVHLHWALPDALTRSNTVRDGNPLIEFPAVPNMWLVTRVIGEDPKQWIVESDYLYPLDEKDGRSYASGAEKGSICYPIRSGHASKEDDKGTPIGPPFRYMGRQVSVVDWPPKDKSEPEYLKGVTGHPLTAVGYGEPSFAAFYPNCHSVFGFHDPDQPASGKNVTYYVIGWYRNGEDDFCSSSPRFMKAFSSGKPKEIQEALHKEFNWNLNEDIDLSAQETPQRLLCFAKLVLTPNNDGNSEPQSAEVQIAVGNTATEALSALLAHKHSKKDNHPNSNTRSILEEQLEALHLLGDLEHRQLDIGPKFTEARHSKGFRAVAGGTIWSVRPVVAPKKDTPANTEEPTLPLPLAHTLNQLNLAQQAYDQACFQIESWRERVFADWYKYMLSAYPPDDQRDDYPDVDEVKFFIEQHDIAPLQKLITTTGKVSLKREDTEPLSPDALQEKSKAEQVQYWWNQVWDLLDAQGTPFQLQQIAGPRFWQPNEPVILLQGTDVEPTDRHSQNSSLVCQVTDFDETQFSDTAQSKVLRTKIDDIFNAQISDLNIQIEDLYAQTVALEEKHQQIVIYGHQTDAEKTRQLDALDRQKFDLQEKAHRLQDAGVFGLRHCTVKPWHPFLLEWDVSVHPTGGEKSNLHATRRAYSPEFITSNYRLAENAIDLVPEDTVRYTVDAGSYQGRSFLTPHAKLALRGQIDKYFEKFVLPDYYKAHPEVAPSLNYFIQNRQDIIKWFQEKGTLDSFSEFILQIENTTGEDFHILAQSLSGFDAAMLGHKQTMQLGVSDPIGFEDYQSFAADVRKAVGSYSRVAPQPHNDFNPIRMGIFKLTNLRLIDTFGQFRDIRLTESTTVAAADSLQNDLSKSGEITLPPRLMQPARLNLRWKSNGHGPGHEKDEDRDDIEMNAHPATSPICGWLLPNNLDNSLMVYSQQGQALGYLDKNNQWRPSPGSRSEIRTPAEIMNPHLRRVVQWIINKPNPSVFLNTFISTLDSALENIDPENWAHHQDLALLMGRPLAVVRASLNLEIKGLPTINHSWDVFWQDLTHGRPADADTDRVRDIQFPVRLGEHRQLNDGLAGYWVEVDKTAELGSDFYSPQSDVDDSKSTHLIHTYLEDSSNPEQEREHENKLQIPLSLKQDPISLTMLVDPRGKVHATSGILPTKSIEIPPDQYAPALQALEITFLSAPVLTAHRGGDDATQIDLPLPDEPGYGWTWVERDSNEQWHESAKIGQVSREAKLIGPATIREGWLALRKSPKEAGGSQ